MGLEKGIFKRTELLLGDEVMDRIANVKVIFSVWVGLEAGVRKALSDRE
jgi:hypothetical protein